MRLTLTLSKEKALPGLSLADLKLIVRETCVMAVPRVFLRPISVTLEVVSTTEDHIQELNLTYRKKNRPTDILSFGEHASPVEVARYSGTNIYLGQIFLSPDFIRRSAREDGVSWKHEFVYVFSHGILHLLGYDHSREMFALQDRITEKLVSSRRKKTL